MRKIVVALSVSVDGYFEAPGHDLRWHNVDEELHEYFNDTLRPMSAFLSGRRTWELMAGYWPTADQNPEADETEREFAGIWRGKAKLVYSRTLTKVGWNAEIVREVVPAEVEALKREPGGDMALGGAELASVFRSYGLIDEYWLYVQPVVLGAGTPLFADGFPVTSLTLLEQRRFGNGVVLLRYRVG